MSHLYEAGVAIAAKTGAAMLANIVPGTPRAEIREIGIFATASAAGEVGIGRPAATGTGGITTQTLVQSLDPNDAAGGTELVSVYVTLQATAPAIPYRRIQLPATSGAGIVWVWAPGELICSSALAGNLVIWQFSGTAVSYDIYVKLVE